MKRILEGKVYDSDKYEVLAEKDHRTHSNNYAGTSYLLRASDGIYLIYNDSNGQDFYFNDDLYICEDPTDWLDGLNLKDEQISRLVELGLLELVE